MPSPRRPCSCQMKRILLALLVLISLSLCGICVLQWQREARLRARIITLVNQLEAENKLRIQAEQKVQEYAREIERLNSLRAEIESKLLTTTEELRDRTVEAIKQRNEEVTAQNTAIEKANTQIKQLLSERDEAITKLNARTIEFNELVEKNNKLSRK